MTVKVAIRITTPTTRDETTTTLTVRPHLISSNDVLIVIIWYVLIPCWQVIFSRLVIFVTVFWNHSMKLVSGQSHWNGLWSRCKTSDGKAFIISCVLVSKLVNKFQDRSKNFRCGGRSKSTLFSCFFEISRLCSATRWRNILAGNSVIAFAAMFNSCSLSCRGKCDSCFWPKRFPAKFNISSEGKFRKVSKSSQWSMERCS